MDYFKAALIGLLLSCQALAIDPPSDSVKKRNGQTATLAWTYTPIPEYTLLYFSVKLAYDLDAQPTEFKQVPSQERTTSFPALFTPAHPKYAYYVVTSITQGAQGKAESLYSRTVMAERIGPPPQ